MKWRCLDLKAHGSGWSKPKKRILFKISIFAKINMFFNIHHYFSWKLCNLNDASHSQDHICYAAAANFLCFPTKNWAVILIVMNVAVGLCANYAFFWSSFYAINRYYIGWHLVHFEHNGAIASLNSNHKMSFKKSVICTQPHTYVHHCQDYGSIFSWEA